MVILVLFTNPGLQFTKLWLFRLPAPVE